VLIINLREVVGLLIVLPQDVFSKKQRRNSVYKGSWKQVETKGCKQRNRCQPRDPDSNTSLQGNRVLSRPVQYTKKQNQYQSSIVLPICLSSLTPGMLSLTASLACYLLYLAWPCSYVAISYDLYQHSHLYPMRQRVEFWSNILSSIYRRYREDLGRDLGKLL
jgi:hypothetical protein